MESIVSFFRRMFDGIINRLSSQIRYKVSDVANSKIRETVDHPFNQRKNNHQTTNRQERNTKY